jgi:transposase
MATVLKQQDNGWEQVLYMALELSNSKWKLAFSAGDRIRKKSIDAGDLAALDSEIGKAKQRFRLGEDCRVVSVYEAGRDGFWIHRALDGRGIESLVVDSASIEVNRKQRRAKTDNVDVEALIRQLMRFAGGEKRALSVVRVPTVEAEDQRRLHRERERVLKERGAHSARIKSLLIAQGIRRKVTPELLEELEELKSPAGYPLGEDLKAEIRREYERYRLADEQIRGLERTQRERLEADPSGALQQVASLLQLRGVGWVSSWVLVMEFFAWRGFRNRKQLAACAGLTPTPYSSGDMERDQGISKAGNRRIRTLLVELSWLWLRYQPNSALTLWFQKRFAGGGKRMRRIGIVAMARKLLVALWRYVEHGEIPQGAVLSA